MSRRERVVKELAHRWPLLKRVLPKKHLPIPTKAGILYVSMANSPTSLQRLFRTYEPKKFDNLQRFLPVGGTFIDIGAHIGDFTVWAARCAGPTGRVLAIEPSPTTLAALRKAVVRNKLSNQVTVLDVAASSEIGTTELLITPQSGTNTIVENELHTLEQFKPRDRITIKTAPLDDLIADAGLARVDVVKIDVEGAELMVLDGATKLLAGSEPLVLLIDLHYGVDLDRLLQILRDARFSLRTEDHPDREIDAVPSGLLSLVAVRPAA